MSLTKEGTKLKCLLYCAKAKPYLLRFTIGNKILYKLDNQWYGNVLSGKIIASCEVECEELHKYEHYEPEVDIGVGVLPEFTEIDYCGNEEEYEPHEWIYKNSCLNFNELDAYLKGKNGYALHISNLKAFDKPLELNELFCNYTINDYKKGVKTNYIMEPNILMKKLSRAPRNMQMVWYKGEKYCLISTESELACKLMSNQISALIRRHVLKELLPSVHIGE